MPDDPRDHLPPVLRELRRDLHRAWRDEEHRITRRRRGRIAVIVAGTAAIMIAVVITASSLLTDSPNPVGGLAPPAALAAQGSAALGDWRLELVQRRHALCAVLRTTGDNATSGRVCDTGFPRRSPLTRAIARSPGGTWVYGLSREPIRAVTIRTGGTERTVRPVPLRNEALRSVGARVDLRGFLIALTGVSAGHEVTVTGRDRSGRRIVGIVRKELDPKAP